MKDISFNRNEDDLQVESLHLNFEENQTRKTLSNTISENNTLKKENSPEFKEEFISEMKEIEKEKSIPINNFDDLFK